MIPVLNEKVLGNSSRITVAVCETPVVLFADLKTRKRFDILSTFNILTCSVPTPTLNMSFSLTDLKSPLTEKNVMIPVLIGLSIFSANSNFIELIPILYVPFKLEEVVDKPPTFTRVLFLKFMLVVAIPTNTSIPEGSNSRFVLVSVE